MASNSSNPFEPLEGIADQLAELLVHEQRRVVRESTHVTGLARGRANSDGRVPNVVSQAVVVARATSAPPHTDTLVLDDETGGADSSGDDAAHLVPQADGEPCNDLRQTDTEISEATSAVGCEGKHAEQLPARTQLDESPPNSERPVKPLPQEKKNGAAQREEFLKQKLEWQAKCQQLDIQLERRAAQLHQLNDCLRNRKTELEQVQRDLLESAMRRSERSRENSPANGANGSPVEPPKQDEPHRPQLSPPDVNEKLSSKPEDIGILARTSEDLPTEDADALHAETFRAQSDAPAESNGSQNGSDNGAKSGVNGHPVNGTAIVAESGRSTDGSVVRWMESSSKREGSFSRFWRRYFP